MASQQSPAAPRPRYLMVLYRANMSYGKSSFWCSLSYEITPREKSHHHVQLNVLLKRHSFFEVGFMTTSKPCHTIAKTCTPLSVLQHSCARHDLLPCSFKVSVPSTMLQTIRKNASRNNAKNIGVYFP